MQSHEIDAYIHGADFQFVEIELDPGEIVVGERGSMLYVDDGIEIKAKMGDGSDPPRRGISRVWAATIGKVLAAVRRSITNESVFLLHFKNISDGKRRVGLTATRPGQIIELNLAELGGEVIAERGAFLCAAAGTKIGVSMKRKLKTHLFGGEGFVLQSITGDGKAFLHAHGTVIEKQLDGGTLLAEAGCLVAMAMQPKIDFSVQFAGGIPTMAFGGEGIFVTKLSGHGRVWLQSQPHSRLRKAQAPTAPSSSGRRRRRR